MLKYILTGTTVIFAILFIILLVIGVQNVHTALVYVIGAAALISLGGLVVISVRNKKDKT